MQMQSIKGETVKRMKREEKVSYPIPEKIRIILYGAGKVGNSYYERLQDDKRIEIVQWIDKNYQILSREGKPVIGPDKIGERKFDFLFITIADWKMAMEIKSELRQNGVDNKKIVWCGTGWPEQFFFKASQLYRKAVEWQTDQHQDPRFFLFLTPEHGNLGDHAILLAERRFFKYYFPGIEVKEITEWEWINFNLLEYLSIISDKDIIFIQGGGNFGNLWGNGLWIRQIVERFPDNKIILLPNTLTYNDNDEEAMKQDAEFYSKQKNVYLLARERTSYEKMQQLCYREDEYLGCYPDMVLWGSKKVCKQKVSTALLCMRTDEEKTLSEEGIEKIKEVLKRRGITFKETSTVLSREIFEMQREELIEEKFMEFSEAAFVVTDRLHGMIFAAIMGVPCIAFNNSTGKVGSVYRWIKELPYIEYVETVGEFERCLDGLMPFKDYCYTPALVREEFDKMAEWVREVIA